MVVDGVGGRGPSLFAAGPPGWGDRRPRGPTAGARFTRSRQGTARCCSDAARVRRGCSHQDDRSSEGPRTSRNRRGPPIVVPPGVVDVVGRRGTAWDGVTPGGLRRPEDERRRGAGGPCVSAAGRHARGGHAHGRSAEKTATEQTEQQVPRSLPPADRQATRARSGEQQRHGPAPQHRHGRAPGTRRGTGIGGGGTAGTPLTGYRPGGGSSECRAEGGDEETGRFPGAVGRPPGLCGPGTAATARQVPRSGLLAGRRGPSVQGKGGDGGTAGTPLPPARRVPGRRSARRRAATTKQGGSPGSPVGCRVTSGPAR